MPEAAAPAIDAGNALPHINAALLTRELGDPRAPANVKLVLGLPKGFSSDAKKVRPEDFRVYVYPAELSRDDGMQDRYRADGIYLWRNRGKIFLDARVVPGQENEGQASVGVIYAPGGVPLAEGMAEGHLRYTSDLVDVVLAVDISRSMLYNDPKKRRVTAARAFIDMARQGGGIGRVGLVTFNHRASKDLPLLPLDQGESIINSLSRIGADGLTNLDTPIELGLEELKDSRKPVIILLTDGKNEGSVYQNKHMEAAKRGVRIFTVGLTEQADHNVLKEMAEATDGIYFRAVKDSDLPEIYARLAAELGKRQLLQARLLSSSEGRAVYPIDGTVKRLVALADAGARVGVSGGGGMFSDGMAAVQLGRPDAGDWNFNWDRATPNVSTLALFGDTNFFLDVFPPQLEGRKLTLGATLAQGANPLAGSSVWVEPVPGVVPRRIQLFDDGMHGDGLAGDGVYAGADVLSNPPEQVDLTFRASGTAWDQGGFVRQTAGLAIRVPEPPPEATVKIGGDVDFGVLFPGETGTAVAHINLDSPHPRELSMDLGWDQAEAGWPDFASSLEVPPGKRAYELEITIPRTAKPGDYTGSFSITDGDEINDRSGARVRVGTIAFDNPGTIDLGTVPPGTFVSRALTIPFHADKAAPLHWSIEGPEDLVVTPGADSVAAGRGEVGMEAMVSAPIGMKEGEYRGRVTLTAGPGTVEIPLVWRVKPYAAKAPSIVPVPGLPKPPELPGDTKPLEQTPEFSKDFWQPEQPAHAAQPLDSIWEKTEDIFRTPQRVDHGASGPAGFKFPTTAKPKDGKSSFWSAWWIYLLAALLLLLLLLLLLAYILYRLGKSALARLLLVSALANIILLIIFILLLSTASSTPAQASQTVTVNLVDDDLPAEIVMTPAEQGLLGGTSLDSGANAGGGGSGSVASEVAMAQAAQAAASSGGQLVSEKQARIPDSADAQAELADAREPAAMPLEKNRERSLNRRERLPERTRALAQPVSDLPEMDEPPPEYAAQQGSSREVGEARLDIAAAEPSTRPVWSDGDKPAQPVTSDAGVLSHEVAGLEKVRMDRTVVRVDPRGRRSNPKEMPASYPEPRVEIDDPARDAVETAAAAPSDSKVGDPGVEEVRVASRAMGADFIGEKTGSLLPPGASRLSDTQPQRMPRGVSGHETAEQALARGGARTSRGGATRDGSAQPGEHDGMPGGLASAEMADAGRTGGGSGRSGGGGAVGEKRFDDASGGPVGGGEGRPGATGSSGTHTAMSGGGGAAAPNPFSGGGAGAGRSEFNPGEGDGGGLTGGPRRNGSAGRGDRTGAGTPDGRGEMPGGAGHPGFASGGEGGGRSSAGRGLGAGLGEGRFDDMASGGNGSGAGSKRGGRLPGLGTADLSGDGDGYGFEIVSLPVESSGLSGMRKGRPGRASSFGASSLEIDSLLLVVGDFSRTTDSAAENLFSRLAPHLGHGLALEERRLSPDDGNLSDCLLATVTPEEVRNWSDAELRRVAAYLNGGGHIWLDAGRYAEAEKAMTRLAGATGGEFGPLPKTHQLAEGKSVDAVIKDDKILVVSTYQDWRREWRYGAGRSPDTLRFLIRGMNYFLSGDAEDGISLEPGDAQGGTLVQPVREVIPELLAGSAVGKGVVWDEFGPETSTSWRMPSWSDAGRISAISDGQGGRALKMDLGAAVKGRAAAYRSLNPPQDFSDVGRVSLDAYYDGGGEATLAMVFTVHEGGGWKDYETPPIRLASGWNKLEFALTGGTLRALSKGGRDAGRLPAANRVGRAGFFLYRDSGTPAVALFRDIRLHEE